VPEPSEILNIIVEEVSQDIHTSLIDDCDVQERIEYVCRCETNRAGIRLLLAALLAKMHNPNLDIRKPYTAIDAPDTYSGRHYDETYIGPLIIEHDLPCNSTTAFLTPAFRNRDETLTPETHMVGRPAQLYQYLLALLSDVHQGNVEAADMLKESIRLLLVIREERKQQLQTLLSQLKSGEDTFALSSEGVVSLIEQHLDCPNSSRLPVLVVAAAYKAVEEKLGERVLPLTSHTAADEQTGALGDVQITLVDDNDVVTSYEMKTRRVTHGDIDRALHKVVDGGVSIDNYIFITTEPIEPDVSEYAKGMYQQCGIEFAILDCIGFVRHFLHLFHRLREQFLLEYQNLVLSEPESGVRHELKQAFLVLRRAAETGT